MGYLEEMAEEACKKTGNRGVSEAVDEIEKIESI